MGKKIFPAIQMARRHARRRCRKTQAIRFQRRRSNWRRPIASDRRHCRPDWPVGIFLSRQIRCSLDCLRYTHGGILAAIVDTAADYAIAAKLGRPVPTISVRVDYHKAAMPGDLIAKARVVRMGSQYSTAEAYVYDADENLVASGRGTYFTAPPRS